jgi:spectinomycin phosphotransferase
MLERAEQLAAVLRSQPLERVLCHTDLHAWNILHGPQCGLHIIDWDDPLLAPKERDLMFIGGGVGGIWNTPREEALFYQGYGLTDINLIALAYYRYERILVDVVEYSQQLLPETSKTSGIFPVRETFMVSQADRERGLHQFTAAFMPGHVVGIAFQTDQRLKEAV